MWCCTEAKFQKPMDPNAPIREALLCEFVYV